MTLNWIGLVAAGATFGGIWFGHVAVRKIDSLSPNVWLPTVLAVGLGAALEYVAYRTSNPAVAAACGILGMTMLWDALEFSRQHHRVRRGHAPANPANPRHARLLAAGQATPLDLLAREPLGRPVGPQEAAALVHRREVAA